MFHECHLTLPIGPGSHLDAALSFYRALRIYPSPVELVMIYQKTVPPPIFQVCDVASLLILWSHTLSQIVMEMMQTDVSNQSSPSGPVPGKPQSVASEDEDETSPTRTGPPSETSSQEWDNVTDPGSSAQSGIF